jgi:hypothetical protein
LITRARTNGTAAVLEANPKLKASTLKGWLNAKITAKIMAVPSTAKKLKQTTASSQAERGGGNAVTVLSTDPSTFPDFLCP